MKWQNVHKAKSGVKIMNKFLFGLVSISCFMNFYPLIQNERQSLKSIFIEFQVEWLEMDLFLWPQFWKKKIKSLLVEDQECSQGMKALGVCTYTSSKFPASPTLHYFMYDVFGKLNHFSSEVGRSVDLSY